MALIAHIDDVIRPEAARFYNHDGPFIDFLESKYPQGFALPYAVLRRDGAEPVALDDFDFVPDPGERVFIVETPGEPISIGGFLLLTAAEVTSLAVSIAISVVLSLVSQLLAPKAPTGANVPAPSPVYSFQANQNSVRLGDPLPVIYGEVIATPDIISQPYVRYDNNNQFFHMLLGLGVGQHSIDSALIGDTPVADLNAGIVDWTVFEKADHGEAMGAIQADTGIYEDVETSRVVQDQELVAPNDTPPPDSVSARFVDETSPADDAIIVGGEVNVSAGDTITVSGSASNDGTYTVNAVTDNRIEVAEALTDEGARTLLQTVTGMSGTTGTAEEGVAKVQMAGRVEIGAIGSVRDLDLLTDVETRTVTLKSRVYDADNDITTYQVTPFDMASFASQNVEVYDPGGVDVEINNDSLSVSGTTGPFSLGVLGGREIDRIELDFIFPSGLYRLSGGVKERTVSVRITYQQETSAGVFDGAFEETVDYTEGTTTPQRKTHVIPISTGTRWRVSVERLTDSINPTDGQDRLLWAGLRARRKADLTNVYGDLTIVAVKIKATQGISGQAQRQFRVKCTRKLPPLGSGTPAATKNPADAFVDAYTNSVYGAGRPLAEMDTTALSAAKTRWAGLSGFNAIFDTRTTVLDALQRIAQVARARPVPSASIMTITQQGSQPVPSHIFTADNIAAGSLRMNFDLGTRTGVDGFEVRYRDPATFIERTALYPADSARPQVVDGFGLTDKIEAEKMARLLWQQDQGERRSVEFVTEMDGHLPQYGDRIGLAHPLGDWGNSARVAEVVPNTFRTELRLDRVPDPATAPTHAFFRDEKGEVEGPIGITDLTGDTVTLASAPTATIFDAAAQQEETIIAFGASSDFYSDWTIIDRRIDEDTITLTAKEYDESVFTGTILDGA